MSNMVPTFQKNGEIYTCSVVVQVRDYVYDVVLHVSTRDGCFWVKEATCRQSDRGRRILHPHIGEGGVCMHHYAKDQAEEFFRAGDILTGLVLIQEAMQYVYHGQTFYCNRCGGYLAMEFFSDHEHKE